MGVDEVGDEEIFIEDSFIEGEDDFVDEIEFVDEIDFVDEFVLVVEIIEVEFEFIVMELIVEDEVCEFFGEDEFDELELEV